MFRKPLFLVVLRRVEFVKNKMNRCASGSSEHGAWFPLKTA